VPHSTLPRSPPPRLHFLSLQHACCNNNGPGQPSGGLWVLEPSLEIGTMFWRMMEAGVPEYNNDGSPQLAADNVTHVRGVWRQSDMMLVRHAFSLWSRDRRRQQMWPKIIDERHGYPEGMRELPLYAAMSDAEFARATHDRWTGAQMPEGFDDSKWDGSSLVWHALPIHYDQCIPNCDCLPWRTNLTAAFSVHFSCFQEHTLHKPGRYAASDAEFHAAINGAESTNCLRYFFRDLWYEKLTRAHGRFPEPLWDPADPRTVATNMTALANPPRHQYVPAIKKVQELGLRGLGWG
jgi:hypothetical protein